MVEEAVLHVQHAKSRVLADSMAALSQGSREAGTAGRWAADIQELRRDLHWHYRQIEDEAARVKPASTERIRRLQQEAGGYAL